MTSDSDWTVDVCLQVPTGYALKGILDVDGKVLSTTDCSQSLVSGTPVIVLFSLTDIGSPEPKLGLSLTTTHKGKKTKTNVTLDGIRRKSKDAQEKSLKAKVKEIGQKIKQEKEQILDKDTSKVDLINLTPSRDPLNESVVGKVVSFFGKISNGISNYASAFMSFLFR